MVPPMVGKLSVAAVAALVLAAACSRQAADSAESAAVHALLASAWSQDADRFEAVVDRPAVRADLRHQLAEVAQANALAVEGGASDAALDRMITPHAFRLVDEGSGQPLVTPPSRAQAAALLKRVGKDRVCVHDQTPQEACLLTFARAKTGWRLVGMAPAGFIIAVAPDPQETAS